MKNASRRRRRPEVEPLESLMLLTTFVAFPFTPSSTSALTATPADDLARGETPALALGIGSTLTVGATRSAPVAARVGTGYSLSVAAPSLRAMPSTETPTRATETLTVAPAGSNLAVGDDMARGQVTPTSSRKVVISHLTIGTASDRAPASTRVISSLVVGHASTTGKLVK